LGTQRFTVQRIAVAGTQPVSLHNTEYVAVAGSEHVRSNQCSHVAGSHRFTFQRTERVIIVRSSH
jgi:hypothetical protein